MHRHALLSVTVVRVRFRFALIKSTEFLYSVHCRKGGATNLKVGGGGGQCIGR